MQQEPEPEPEPRARIRFRFFLGQNDTFPAVPVPAPVPQHCFERGTCFSPYLRYLPLLLIHTCELGCHGGKRISTDKTTLITDAIQNTAEI